MNKQAEAATGENSELRRVDSRFRTNTFAAGDDARNMAASKFGCSCRSDEADGCLKAGVRLVTSAATNLA
jgi:hypothetical protein